MRQIAASEVKPGMKIRWKQGGITYECTVSSVWPASFGVNVMAQRSAAHIYDETPVTVLVEPQPEEPQEFGARVVVDGRHFLRADGGETPWVESDVWGWFEWYELCRIGQVTVIPDQGWTAPADTEPAPVVPDRIEEWPEDDEHLRGYAWRDKTIGIWVSHSDREKWDCRSALSGISFGRCDKPFDGPWTRVTDA